MREKSGEIEPPALDAHVQSHIGRRLRSLFDEVATAPVPDRFLFLLDQLERGNGAGDAKIGPGPDTLDSLRIVAHDAQK